MQKELTGSQALCAKWVFGLGLMLVGWFILDLDLWYKMITNNMIVISLIKTYLLYMPTFVYACHKNDLIYFFFSLSYLFILQLNW